MNDKRFDVGLKLYDVIRELEELERDFRNDASGSTNCLSTFVRDTLQHQGSILAGVADTINSLSNLMHEAEKGRLLIMDGGDVESGGIRQIKVDLTSERYRDGL